MPGPVPHHRSLSEHWLLYLWHLFHYLCTLGGRGLGHSFHRQTWPLTCAQCKGQSKPRFLLGDFTSRFEEPSGKWYAHKVSGLQTQKMVSTRKRKRRAGEEQACEGRSRYISQWIRHGTTWRKPGPLIEIPLQWNLHLANANQGVAMSRKHSR